MATKKFLSSSTVRKRKRTSYQQKLEVKRRRREGKRKNTKVGLRQKRVDKNNGTTYQRGIATYFNGVVVVDRSLLQSTISTKESSQKRIAELSNKQCQNENPSKDGK